MSWSVRAWIVIGGIAFQPIVHQYIGLSIILHGIFDENERVPAHVKRAECKLVSLWDPPSVGLPRVALSAYREAD